MSNGDNTVSVTGIAKEDSKRTESNNILSKLEKSNELAIKIKTQVNELYNRPAPPEIDKEKKGITPTVSGFFATANALINELNQNLRDIDSSLKEII